MLDAEGGEPQLHDDSPKLFSTPDLLGRLNGAKLRSTKRKKTRK